MSDTENFNAGDATREAFEKAQRSFETMADPQAFRDAQAAMGLDPARMSEALRTMTERSAEQSRQAYGRLKDASEQATHTLEATLENAHNGSLALSKRALEGLRAQAEANFSHMEKLAGVRSFAEFVELQSSFLRRQIEMATDQARDMQTLTQSVARDVSQPGRDAPERSGG